MSQLLQSVLLSSLGASELAEGRDLISVADFSPEEIANLFALTSLIKWRPQDFSDALEGKQLVMFFEKPSLRTRMTFEAGMAGLGGTCIFVDQTQQRLGEREPLADVAHNLERWISAVVLRTFSHTTITELARHASVPVINALSDSEHPCQAFADYFTLQEKFGDLRNIKLAYVGDGNNVAHSLMLAAASLGSHIALATPTGYEPDAEVTAEARRIAAATGGSIELHTDPIAAVVKANAVYTDVWASMGQEAEAESRAAIFAPYQVTDRLMACAAANAIFMHCLPAHRGDEVIAAVIDGARSVVFDQSENRLHVQKAILLTLLGGGVRRFPPRSAHA